MDEQQKYKESEKKKKEALNLQELEVFLKQKEQIRTQLTAQEELDSLKNLVEIGLVPPKMVETILAGEILPTEKTKELLLKLDELNQSGRLPGTLQIQKQEYLEAFSHPDLKQKMIQKIDAGLDFVYQESGGWRLFGIMTLLSVQLSNQSQIIQTQETLIDLKNNLI